MKLKDYVLPGNPIVKQLLGLKDRYTNLSQFKIKVENNVRYCAWCYSSPITNKHHNAKYCSSNCQSSALIWTNPQSDFSFQVLLERQEYLCACGCNFNYLPSIELAYKIRIAENNWYDQKIKTSFNSYHLEREAKKKFIEEEVKRLNFNIDKLDNVDCYRIKDNFFFERNGFNNQIEEQNKPEVDHIIPVALGGETLGIDNLQILTTKCHSLKTKIDITNIRKRK